MKNAKIVIGAVLIALGVYMLTTVVDTTLRYIGGTLIALIGLVYLIKGLKTKRKNKAKPVVKKTSAPVKKKVVSKKKGAKKTKKKTAKKKTSKKRR